MTGVQTCALPICQVFDNKIICGDEQSFGALYLVLERQNRAVHAGASDGDASDIKREAAGDFMHAGRDFNDFARQCQNELLLQ